MEDVENAACRQFFRREVAPALVCIRSCQRKSLVDQIAARSAGDRPVPDPGELGDPTEARQDTLSIVWRTEARRQSDQLIKCEIAPACAGRRPPVGR